MPVDRLPHALRNSMACPAIPTCDRAVAEAERALPALIRTISAVLGELGLREERMSAGPTGRGERFGALRGRMVSGNPV